MFSQYFRFRAARGSERRRSALLERLLARADACAPAGDWRADAFRLIVPGSPAMPAVGPAVLCADRGATDASWVCMASPVCYVAEMSTVRLPQDGMLTLSAAGAGMLATDFNRVWEDSGFRLEATRSAQLLCTFDRPLEVCTRDPEQALGQEIEEFLPAGVDSGSLRRLISETEMWLFEHAANRARRDLGEPAINGLWFWGGGAPLFSPPILQGWVAGDDPFFNAIGSPAAARAPRASEHFGSGVIALHRIPGTDRWAEAESRWLDGAVRLLKDGAISELQLSADERCFSVTARGLRRFWRRSKPWWEYFD